MGSRSRLAPPTETVVVDRLPSWAEKGDVQKLFADHASADYGQLVVRMRSARGQAREPLPIASARLPEACVNVRLERFRKGRDLSVSMRSRPILPWPPRSGLGRRSAPIALCGNRIMCPPPFFFSPPIGARRVPKRGARPGICRVQPRQPEARGSQADTRLQIAAATAASPPFPVAFAAPTGTL